MSFRLGLLAASGLMAAACASQPASTSSSGSNSGAVALTPAVTAAVANMAATTTWMSEERLLPQEPILAMVETGGTVDSPKGFAVTCNPDNGSLTGHLGMQPADKAGTEATYRIRLGGRADRISGSFQTDASGDTKFVFPMEASALRQMSTLDTVTILDASAQPQWAFVSSPNTAVSAKYVGTLSNIDMATQEFLVFCNPK